MRDANKNFMSFTHYPSATNTFKNMKLNKKVFRDIIAGLVSNNLITQWSLVCISRMLSLADILFGFSTSALPVLSSFTDWCRVP